MQNAFKWYWDRDLSCEAAIPFLLVVSGNVNGLCIHFRNVFYIYDFLDVLTGNVYLKPIEKEVQGDSSQYYLLDKNCSH